MISTRKMNRTVTMKIWLTAMLISFHILSHAQQSSDSLWEYMEIAARENPVVLQKFAEYQAALEKVPQVGSLPDPEFSLGVFIRPMELVDGRQVADMRLMQMFPWFGTLKAAKDEMSLMAKSKCEAFGDAKLQVFYDVQTVWYELLMNREEIRNTGENLRILQSVERIALTAFKAPPAEGNNAPAPMPGSSMNVQADGSDLASLYRIKIELADLANADSLLISRQRTLIARFNALLNRPAGMPVQLADTLMPVMVSFELPEVTDSLFDRNPMLVMLEYERQSLDARKEMATRMGFPMIGLGVNYSVIQKNDMSSSEMNGKDMVMPMVTFTIPIFRQKYKASRNEAGLLKKATELGYQATYNSIRSDYYEILQDLQDAERRMRLNAGQRDLASKTLDIMLKSFAANGTGLTEILQTRRQVLDYSLKEAEAIADYNIAVAGLKRILAITSLP